ncbi:MAG: PSD1 and planctomycete cytochrome C domain-containing protein [Bryobacteraceae bacterium]
MRFLLHAVLAFITLAIPAPAADDVEAGAVQILTANCSQCHSKSAAMAGLDLSTRETALKGGQRGPSIIPGDSASSRLIQAVMRQGTLAMPPLKALPAADIEVLRRWIDGGAKWPDGPQASDAKWWSFRKPVRPQVPRSGNAWVRNEIDEFVLRKLGESRLHPAPEANRATLILRMYFDLTGLPPTAAQVRAFVEDRSPDSETRLVEELLASPRYGEKWARHWLDLVRYADTAGFELDPYIADAWRYRDYVIQSFNEDKPYDRFIREQIAGDEFFPEDPVAQTGTGFYCVGPNRDLYPDQSDINREETLTDFVDTTVSVFQGLTAGCARCHDHKFDPIPQADYFRVQAIFAPAVKTKVALNRLSSLGYEVAANVREIKLREIGDRIRAVQERCRKEIADWKKGRPTDEAIRACLSPEESAQLREIETQLVSMFANYQPKPFACGITDMWNVSPKTYLPEKSGRAKQEVEPGFFAVLGGGEVPPAPDKRETTGPIPLYPTTGRRSALAKWIATPENPLTARVMVNRIWQYHFGRGIVATPSDFGSRGRPPSHPELLDWLATEFVARGWSVKQIHRLILNSATYQQNAKATPEAAERDPENLLLSHFSRRRLQSDELRDAVLQVTGSLNLSTGGRPVVPPMSKEELHTFTQRPENAWVVTADASEHVRRSIYLLQKRTFRLPMMEVFDTPESMLTCPRRESSTTAPQSLTLLNGPFAVEQGKKLADALVSESKDDAALVDAAWRRVLARDPQAEERRMAIDFLTKQTDNTGSRTGAAVELIRGLLNLNEFLYVD